MNYKKILKLSSELREARHALARCENNIPSTMAEMKLFFEQEAGKDKGKNEAQCARRKRGFMERINRDKDLCEQFKVQISVLEESLKQEGAAVIAEIQAALAADHGHQATVCDELKKEIARLKFRTMELEKQYQAEDLLKENKRLLVRDFSKKWSPEQIVELIISPEKNDDGNKAGRIIRFLPDSVQSAWQRAMDKRSQQQKKEREASERQQKEIQARNRKFYDEAILITQGKIPMPPELAPLYNNTSIELNVLQDFLMRKAGVIA